MFDLRAGGFKSSVKFGSPLGAGLTSVLVLAGCGQGEEAWAPPAERAAADTTAEAGYLAPPTITSARLIGEAVRVEGVAAPGARVRIAPPRGEPILIQADIRGRWRARLTPSQPVHLFGLSMTQAGRAAQSEGYIMMTAEGQVAQLRAGAGAVSLAEPSSRPKILAVDYDRDGGAVVSGIASPGVTLGLRVDRAQRGETKADARGRFSISLTEPLAMGSREIEVAGEGGEDMLSVDITPIAGVGAGPYVGRRTPYGWRVDWMPPGGGIQSTLIFERPAA